MTKHISMKSEKEKKAEQAEGRTHDTAKLANTASTHADILRLQRVAGNRAVSQLLQPEMNDDVPSSVYDVLNKRQPSSTGSQAANVANSQSRIVYMDTSVVAVMELKIAEAQQAANHLKRMLASGINVRIALFTTSEMTNVGRGPTGAEYSAARRQLLQDLQRMGVVVETTPPLPSMAERINLSVPNPVSKSGKSQHLPAGYGDIQLVIRASQQGAEIWTYDRDFTRSEWQTVLAQQPEWIKASKQGMNLPIPKLAPESIPGLKRPEKGHYNNARQLLSLPLIQSSPTAPTAGGNPKTTLPKTTPSPSTTPSSESPAPVFSEFPPLKPVPKIIPSRKASFPVGSEPTPINKDIQKTIKPPVQVVVPPIPAREAGERQAGRSTGISGGVMIGQAIIMDIRQRQEWDKAAAELEHLKPKIEEFRRKGEWVVVYAIMDQLEIADPMSQMSGYREEKDLLKFVDVTMQLGRTLDEARNPPDEPPAFRAIAPDDISFYKALKFPAKGRVWHHYEFGLFPPLPGASQEPIQPPPRSESFLEISGRWVHTDTLRIGNRLPRSTFFPEDKTEWTTEFTHAYLAITATKEAAKVRRWIDDREDVVEVVQWDNSTGTLQLKITNPKLDRITFSTVKIVYPGVLHEIWKSTLSGNPKYSCSGETWYGREIDIRNFIQDQLRK